MGDNSVVNGLTIIWMGMGFTLGGMEESIEGSIEMIRNMGMECINGQMEESMEVTGTEGNNMGLELIMYQKKIKRSASAPCVA